MSKNNICLGILGGLGPMSSAYFYELITAHTLASTDQDHIDIILSSKSTTPDRTDYILGISSDDPSLVMLEEIKKLCNYGADIIAIPCNTAHYFHEKLLSVSTVPVLNMIEETVKICKNKGAKKIGVLATKGTIQSSIYSKICEKYNVDCYSPTSESQKLVSAIIYDQIKAGIPAKKSFFEQVKRELDENGCDCAVLGCTELSVAKKQLGLGKYYVDSLEALAYKSILACNKTPINFEDLLG